MKTVKPEPPMQEDDIRPRALFERLLELASEDARTYFSNAHCRPIPCPACGGTGEHVFDKNGFAFARCPDCLTLYVNPRPEEELFRAFYRDSPSARFMAEEFYPSTAQARRERIWKPRAAQVDALIAAHLATPCRIIDIGGGLGLFAEETMRLGRNQVLLVEPCRGAAAACRDKGLPVLERFLEEVRGEDLETGPKCFVSFELFEHLYDPGIFLETLHRLMEPEDLFIFTTLSGTGADILALWDKAPAISPPHHLNFFNPKAIATLLARKGFTTVEVSTPGELDVSIMENHRDDIRDRFWATLLAQADAEQKQAAQAFLRNNRLSSHMRVVARKAPGDAPTT